MSPCRKTCIDHIIPAHGERIFPEVFRFLIPIWEISTEFNEIFSSCLGEGSMLPPPELKIRTPTLKNWDIRVRIFIYLFCTPNLAEVVRYLQNLHLSYKFGEKT